MSEDTERPSAEGEEAVARRRAWLAVNVAATALLAAFVLAGPVPVRVTVDGIQTWVLRGTTVAGLLRQHRLAATAGDLVTPDGRTVVAQGGAPLTITLDGESAPLGAPLDSGESIVSRRGLDLVEPTVIRTIETTPAVRYRGTGPRESVEESGTPGTAEVVFGAVSGEERSRRVISTGMPTTIRREPAWRGAMEVALTFDDGPWPGSTDAILSELKSAGVKATFFMVGSAVKRRPSVAKRVLAAGMEIGNHSLSHRSLGRASVKTIGSQVRGGSNTIRRVLGIRARWFRPPGGSWSSAVKREVKKRHERFVLWTVDPRDWSRPGVRVIAQRVLDHVRPGSIVLMHDGGGDRSQTVAALRLVIAGLKGRGYSMVTLSRLKRLPELEAPPAAYLLAELTGKLRLSFAR
jgi:peptidoglycan/xylan/chitin deacetylase (PgdA/CDA1 family)